MFFAAFGVGKWNKATLRLMFNKFEDYVQQPTSKNKLEIYSDGNNDYKTVLPDISTKILFVIDKRLNQKMERKYFQQ